jgi:hypothetical protein
MDDAVERSLADIPSKMSAPGDSRGRTWVDVARLRADQGAAPSTVSGTAKIMMPVSIGTTLFAR